MPELNVRLVGGYAVPRPGIDVFFITAIAKGRDLTGVEITDVNRKNVVHVAHELEVRSQRMRLGNDPDIARAKRTMDKLPRPVLRSGLRLAAWVAGARARSIPALGVIASPFGSAMVSSVGMFGIPMGFAPLVWMYRVPLLVLVGEITDKPVAVGGAVEVRPVLAFREYLHDPAAFEPTVEVDNVVPLRRAVDHGNETDASIE